MMLAVFMAVIMIVFTTALAGRVYHVGDDNGWTNIGHYDYKTWAASKFFKVGDTIIFRYNKEFHNVVRVSYTDYIKCNGDNAYSTLTSGNDSFPIKYPGHYFFICTIPDHCQSGQKVDIRVPGTPASNSRHSSPPITTPTTAPIQPLPFPYPPPSVPSPAPAKTPATSPAPIESPATPSPANTPVAPSPAKIPLGPSPAKTPTSPKEAIPTQAPDPLMPGDAPNDTKAPEVAPAAPKSTASQAKNGLKTWSILMMFLFYVIM